MSAYIIGYDLHPTRGETYEDLIEAIKKVGTNWWHHLDSTWVVVTSKTAAQVRDELWQHMKADDQLLVVESSHTAAWAGFSDQGSQWLNTHV